MIERRTITDRRQWLAWRRQDITASDVAAILNMNPWRSPLRVWAEKTGQACEAFESNIMRRGRWMEPAVLEALRDDMPGTEIRKLDVYLRDTEDSIGATPDAVAHVGGIDALVECKVVSKPSFDEWGDEPPRYYQLQCITNAMLWGCEQVILAALVLDTFTADLHLFHIERNPITENGIREAVRSFWRNTEAGTFPAIANYAYDGAILAELYRPRDEKAPPIDLTGDNLLQSILEEREALCISKKIEEERIDAIKAEIIDKLKGAPSAICGRFKISHRVQHRAEHVVKATSYPALRVTASKEKPA